VTTTYGTLSVVCGFPAEAELVRRCGSSPADSGFVASRQFNSSVSRQSGRAEVKVWRVRFPTLTNEDLVSLLTAFEDAQGDALPISWTPPVPHNTAHPVRFLTGSLRVRRFSGSRSEAEVELEECI
jgi:hypothetical protein